MSVRKLAEGAVSLIVDYIKANIDSALDGVGGAAGIPDVSLESPKAYFIFEKPNAHTLPAVFVILPEIDFKIAENKSNFINASDKISVSILVEDQDEEMLTYKCWRYQSALHSVLDEAEISSQDKLLKLKSVVYRATFSPLFMRTEGSGDGGKFRKEVVLQCEVLHAENF